MMRVGILCHGFAEWGGGIDFLRIVISSLQHSGEPVEIRLLLPSRGPRLAAREKLHRVYRGVRSILGRPVPPHGKPDPAHLHELMADGDLAIGLHEIDIGPAAIAQAARHLSLDVLLPAHRALPGGFPVPWVGYVYDFQHRYLPHLFADQELKRRDAMFSAMLAGADAVIVNAKAVADDIRRFHPSARSRVFVLPFSAAPRAAWLVPTEGTAQKYGIGRRYFIVCNQFWKHKDHTTAFAAFRQIAASHPDLELVCTGTTSDYRDPGYVTGLRQMLARDGLASRVHILGMVPKHEQISLLKGAIALVQPTLFEGGPGGGAVFDAISLGVPCVVSDIAVNLEIDDPTVSFFKAGSVEELSALMSNAAERPVLQRPSPETLLDSGRKRRIASGRVLLDAIQHVRPPHAADDACRGR